MAAPTPHRDVVLGRVNGVFGVDGWIKVYSYTRPIEAIFDYSRWLIGEKDNRRVFRLLDGRVQGKTLVARIANDQGEPLPNRNAAIECVDLDIAVARADMPELDAGRYYWVDLIGLSVITVNDVSLGYISALMETGANDVLVVSGERERLIPWVMDECVVQIDLEARRIIVDWDPDF